MLTGLLNKSQIHSDCINGSGFALIVFEERRTIYAGPLYFPFTSTSVYDYMSSEYAWNAIHSNSNKWPYCLTLASDVCTMPCTSATFLFSTFHRANIYIFLLLLVVVVFLLSKRINIFYVTPNKIKLHLGMQPHYASPYSQNICACMLYARWKSTFSVVIQHSDAFRAWKRNERTGKRAKQKWFVRRIPEWLNIEHDESSFCYSMIQTKLAELALHFWMSFCLHIVDRVSRWY